MRSGVVGCDAAQRAGCATGCRALRMPPRGGRRRAASVAVRRVAKRWPMVALLGEARERGRGRLFRQPVGRSGGWPAGGQPDGPRGCRPDSSAGGFYCGHFALECVIQKKCWSFSQRVRAATRLSVSEDGQMEDACLACKPSTWYFTDGAMDGSSHAARSRIHSLFN